MATIVGMKSNSIKISVLFVEKEEGGVKAEMIPTSTVSFIYCDSYQPIDNGKGKNFTSKPILKELEVEFNGLDGLQKIINNLTVIHNEMLKQRQLGDIFLNGQEK